MQPQPWWGSDSSSGMAVEQVCVFLMPLKWILDD